MGYVEGLTVLGTELADGLTVGSCEGASVTDADGYTEGGSFGVDGDKDGDDVA